MSGRPLRIAMCCHEYPPHSGGIEFVVRELSERMAVDHEVVVVTSAHGSKSGIERRGRLSVFRLPSLRPLDRWGVPYTVPTGACLREARAALSRCDVIHAHGTLYAQSWLAAREAQRGGMPLVVTEHVGWVPYSNPLLRGMQSIAWHVLGDRILTRAECAVVLNTRVLEWVRSRRPALDVYTISNGVDLSRFRPASDDERQQLRQRYGLPLDRVLALAVGRDSPKKQWGALRAWTFDTFELVTCGNSLPPLPRVHVLGAIASEQMPEVYRACDFLVHAGVGEGFPLTVQEAMASALPVALLWDDAYDAVLPATILNAATDLAALRATCSRLAVEPAHRRVAGRAARDFAVAQWGWEQTVSAHLALYHTLLAKKSDRKRPAIEGGGR